MHEDAHPADEPDSVPPVETPIETTLPIPVEIVPALPQGATLLNGDAGPLPRGGPLGLIEGLLRMPANVLHEVQTRRSMPWRLLGVVIGTMLISGVIVAAFSGGLQYLAVPVKLAGGMVFCAIICLPSLYIFAALSGGQASLRETWGALLMGVALTGVLLVGFAPVSWVFSQATSSPKFMGALHLGFLFLSAYFGLRLTRRVLEARTGHSIGGLRLWAFMFLLVVVQMTTTLRPLLGEFEGPALAPKLFFLEHWFS